MDGPFRPTIITARLTLRPWRLTDIADVFAYARDPEWGRFLPVPVPYEPVHAEGFVARCITTNWSRNVELALELEGHAVGGVSIRLDPARDAAELGYSLARWLWGQGYMTEAAAAAAAWAFEAPGVHRVFAWADPRNVGSTRVMEKLGMRREALLRSHAVVRGERTDEVRYGMLRDELAQDPRRA